MTDRPILFSAPMVRALLDGRKTQTRRLLKPQPFASGYFDGEVELTVIPANDQWPKAFRFNATAVGGDAILGEILEPRINQGDLLWVREEFSGPSWFRPKIDPPASWPVGCDIWYWADGNPPYGDWTKPKQSMHMPRWMSRLTLTVTDVRVERLQDIREADAIAEGAELTSEFSMVSGGRMVRVAAGTYLSPIAWYHWLWDQINGPKAWDANPWVVAYTFTVERGNIDQIARAA